MIERLTNQRRWLAAQLVAVLAVLGAGIGGAVWFPASAPSALHTTTNARVLVEQAVTRITTVGTFRMTFEFEIGIHGGRTVKTRGTGLVDIVRNVQTGEFDIPGFGKLSIRQVGARAYLGVPGGRADALGHHWIGIPVKGAASFGSQDPLQLLRALSDSSGVENKGSEKVAGVPTTHYRVVLDAQRLIAAAQANGSTQPVPASVASQFKDGRADLWIDAKSLPRRMRLSFGTAQVSFRFQFQFADYGGDVRVTEPPATDVTPAPTMQAAILDIQGFLHR